MKEIAIKEDIDIESEAMNLLIDFSKGDMRKSVNFL